MTDYRDAKRKTLEQVPHFDRIVKNGTVTIPSIFMFKGGAEELFPFLYACKQFNCTVVFENEDLIAEPKDESEAFRDVIFAVYMSVIENQKIAGDYMRYLTNIEKMKWENCN